MSRTEGRKNVKERFDVSILQSEEIRTRYNIEVRNRFEILGDIYNPEEENDMIWFWQHIEMQQRKSWGGQSNLVGKIEIGRCKIRTTETEMEGGV